MASNVSSPGVIGAASVEAESEAFDALGPMLRTVLRDAPVKVLAAPIMREVQAMRIDPRDPAVDATLACNLAHNIEMLLRVDRSAQDAAAAMHPLQAKRGRRR